MTPTTPEPRSASFLNGERVFHSSVDPRISSNRKVACGSCHVYGEQDGRAWEMQFLPGAHGPRQTQSILGLGASMGPIDPATGLGQLHRSGDRDEVQDFDHTFRGQQMGGTGFIAPRPASAPARRAQRRAERRPRRPRELRRESRCASAQPAPQRRRVALRGRGAGATFFMGVGRASGDAKCASCHVPETGWVDFTFHDVGQRHDPGEAELNTRAPFWGVNTASLLGVFDSRALRRRRQAEGCRDACSRR